MSASLPSEDPTSRPLGFAEVLACELAVVAPEVIDHLGDEPKTKEALDRAIDAKAPQLSALCLSGGGIRSAIFGLGVMQALARFGLLGEFHYLSTVSGGGYIGSWLSVWRSLTPDTDVFPAMNALMSSAKDPGEIRGIRFNSNYITPKLGLLSADTWTILTLYLRNLALNWLIFTPFFTGCLLYPLLWSDVLIWGSLGATRTHYGFLAAGVCLLVLGLSVAMHGRFRMKGEWLSERRFIRWVLIPVVLSASCICVAAEATPSPELTNYVPVGALVGTLTYLISWWIGRMLTNPSRPDKEDPDYWDLLAWVLSGALVGVIVAALLHLVSWVDHPQAGPILGLSACVLAYLVGEIFYVGAASFCKRSDMDREWLARASGWLGATAIGWAVFSTIAICGPIALNELNGYSLTALGGISGLVTLIFGSSEKTGATVALQAVKKLSLNQIVSIAAVIFALVLGIILAAAGQRLSNLLNSIPAFRDWWLGFLVTEGLLCLLLVGVAFFLSYFVNVNRFSLHALYRNRVARAFIGSARSSVRKADPFTGFDDNDNLNLCDAVPCKKHESRLFHVINASLNILATDDLAWQERKAESFTFTRQHCGNLRVGFRPSRAYGGEKKGGVTLATAVAISGAAVSPNQGYNSSPLVGFLLMLFNVRLGWWLGNPKFKWFDREGPVLGITPALKELAGNTTDKEKWIYLSDGGHFENLGLYEMVRRRCRMIVISDAGCDPSFTFEDLGNAARKVFIDFGVSIEFSNFELKARANPPVAGARYAVGQITYPGSKAPGWLLYIKPTYQATERMDIRSYASQHLQFPHESTADQWFSESQLESYRALGAHVTESICTTGSCAPCPGQDPEKLTLALLKQRVGERACPAAADHQPND